MESGSVVLANATSGFIPGCDGVTGLVACGAEVEDGPGVAEEAPEYGEEFPFVWVADGLAEECDVPSPRGDSLVLSSSSIVCSVPRSLDQVLSSAS